MFYSETDGSKEEGPYCLLWRKGQFPPLENTMCSGTKIEMTADSLKEIAVEEEARI